MLLSDGYRCHQNRCNNHRNNGIATLHPKKQKRQQKHNTFITSIIIILQTFSLLALCNKISLSLYHRKIQVSINAFGIGVANALSIQPKPSFLKLEHIYQSYPVTLQQRLFSSVPRRKYALEDVSLTFGCESSCSDKHNNGLNIYKNGISLLVGRSASGKSTLLRIASGEETPKSGTVFINGQTPFYDNSKDENIHTKPIIINSKLQFVDAIDSSSSKSILDQLIHFGRTQVTKQQQQQQQHKNYEVVDAITHDFLSIMGFTPTDLNRKHRTTLDLSPSEQYAANIVCACVKSVASTLPSSMNDFNGGGGGGGGVHYPILLLDELFDFETSDVTNRVAMGLSTQKTAITLLPHENKNTDDETATATNNVVAKGLKGIVEHGGIVVAATHRPNHFDNRALDRIITMSGGGVLTDEDVRVSSGYVNLN